MLSFKASQIFEDTGRNRLWCLPIPGLHEACLILERERERERESGAP
jgi:hypothetical protein